MQINLKLIAAMAKYGASTEATRYYICGVYIDVSGDDVIAVAANGSTMIVSKLDIEGEKPVESFIIPADVLKAYRFKKRGKGLAELTFDGSMAAIEYNEQISQFKPIDGTFPQWRRVVPAGGYEPSMASYKSNDLKVFSDFGRTVLNDDKPSIVQNGSDQAFVKFSSADTFGVIMPMRMELNSSTPNWL